MKNLIFRLGPFLLLFLSLTIITGCSDSSEKKDSSGPSEYSINSTLVSPAWVNKLIKYHEDGSASEAPIDYEYDRDHSYLIFETSWGPVSSATDYNNGHVPGAIHSDSDVYENGDPRWFIKSDAEIFDAMESMGITSETTVIVYSSDPIFAARLWWILKYAGLEDVRYLDGGYEKWVADGFDGETTVNSPESTSDQYTGPVNYDFIATVDYVEDNSTDTDNYILADVRTEAEYNGETSGYSYVIEKGRIPNAIWFYPVDNGEDRYFNEYNTLKSTNEILSMWEDLGVNDGTANNTFDKEIIFYCGSGYRSASAFLYAYLMGYTNIRNFSDGWEGWSTTYTYDDASGDATTDATADCPAGAGERHGAWPSLYCQKPSGRPIETGSLP